MIIYDGVTDQILVSTGNASPYNARLRDPNSVGDNLFLSSILALDADTSKYKWHFQETPRDVLDYTTIQSITLSDMPAGEGSKTTRVIMHAPKNGF